MAMVTYKKKCPHCKKVYDSGSYSNALGAGSAAVYRYGSPFRRCAYCSQNFVDKDYHEIAVEGIREPDTQKVSTGTILISIAGAMFSLALMNSDYAFFGIILLFLSVCSILHEFLTYKKRQAFLQKEKEASEQRLKNPGYALALKKLGVNVPEKYLS